MMQSTQRYICAVIAATMLRSTAGQFQVDPICENFPAQLSCPIGQVISVADVFYGANETELVGGCSVAVEQEGDCVSRNALGAVQDLCDGLNSCSFDVNNDNLNGDPCPGRGITKFLEANFTCGAAQEFVETFEFTVGPFCENQDDEEALALRILECPDDLVISVTDVFYGANSTDNVGDCSDATNPACRSDRALDIISAACNNLNLCEPFIDDDSVGSEQCPEDVQQFVEIDFDCVNASTGAIHIGPICENLPVQLSCPIDQVISIGNVFYGANETEGVGGCSVAIEEVGDCTSRDALGAVQDLCDGLNSCEFESSNDDLNGDPCGGGGITKFLEVDYTCTEGLVLARTIGPVCENSAVQIDCPQGFVVQINNAIYGANETEGVAQCSDINRDCKSTSVVPALLAECFGENLCEFDASNDVLGGDPCPGDDTTKFFYVEAICVVPSKGAATAVPTLAVTILAVVAYISR